jgi:hypothetical protein
MKRLSQPKGWVLIIFAALTFAFLISGLTNTVFAADPNSGSASSSTNSVASPTTPPEVVKVKVKQHLTGAELYSIHCNRCHQERYPTERTGAQWKTIMLHMQVRANIPVSQSRLILKYLQENSGR